LTSAVYFSQYWKGAARAAPPTGTELLGSLAGNPVNWGAFDKQMAGRAVTELKSRGLPPLLTVYFAGTDGIAHKEGIASQAAYLSGTVDPLLGHILDTIESLDRSWRKHTLFVLVSDHGRTDRVPHPEDLSLKADLQAALPAGATIAANGGVAISTWTSPAWWTLRSWRRRWCRMPKCRPRWPPCGCAARRIRRATAT
jgi:predicted AlkP superfamily pyrophosphatase or phosphodiesterase